MHWLAAIRLSSSFRSRWYEPPVLLLRVVQLVWFPWLVQRVSYSFRLLVSVELISTGNRSVANCSQASMSVWISSDVTPGLVHCFPQAASSRQGIKSTRVNRILMQATLVFARSVPQHILLGRHCVSSECRGSEMGR